uniref:Reverse transcriptase domain-containing protein n=1 Tax=Latimeria chalumnae TaxID=7897 RepID=H3AG92_LATCH
PNRKTPELLKCAIEPTSAALHQLSVWVWTTGKVPMEWKEGIIISLYKGKGSRTECSSKRPITLLSVPRKVFSQVLLARLQSLLTKHRHPEQSGFTAGRSIMDSILALHLLSEIHREFNHPLRKALQGIGIPDTLLRLIQDLHNGSGAWIRLGNHKSERFYTRSGVRQGCVLAPAPFCRAMDWILKHITANISITISWKLFSDLDYADNVVLLGLDANNLRDTLESFQREAASLGLQVSWVKTKIQSIGANAAIQGIQVDGQTVEAVDNFIYLGSKLLSNGYSEPDVLRRIGIAASAMKDLHRVWSQGKVKLSIKVWTPLKQDMRKLETFHMHCQRRLLGIKWSDFIRNTVIATRTGLERIEVIINHRRWALFGHIGRLGD